MATKEKDSMPDMKSRFMIPTYTSNRRTTSFDLKGKLSSKPAIRTPFPSQRKMPPPHYKFYYDKGINGWKEREKQSAVTRWNKAKDALRVGNFFIAMKKKPGTVLNIDVKSLVKATIQSRMENSNTTLAVEIEDELERALQEASTITKPFVRQQDQNYDGVWKLPQSARASNDRNKDFEWDKPKAERRVLVESASKYQAEYLQKVIKEKEKEMRLIVNQLLKANKENVSLLKELDGYRGKNYDELYKENIVLKDQISRACKENVTLAGQLRKRDNKRLQKLEREQTVA